MIDKTCLMYKDKNKATKSIDNSFPRYQMILKWSLLTYCQQGLYSLSGRTSYRKISRSLEAARFWFRLLKSFWNLTDTSAARLPKCLSNFRWYDHYNIQSRDFETSRDLAVLPLSPGNLVPNYNSSSPNVDYTDTHTDTHTHTHTHTHTYIYIYICVSELGQHWLRQFLFSVRCHAITWTNADLLSTQSLRTNGSEIRIKIHSFSSMKIYFENIISEIVVILFRGRCI